jgi:hypothetical protein
MGVSRSAVMKWLSFNFTARAHASVKYPTPQHLSLIITEIQIGFFPSCHSLRSRVFWVTLLEKRGRSKGRYFTTFGNAAGYRGGE